MALTQRCHNPNYVFMTLILLERIVVGGRGWIAACDSAGAIARRAMPKRSPVSSSGRRSTSTPPLFSPMVTGVPTEDFNIEDAQFAQLEEVGDVKLSDQQRTRLITLGNFWTDDLRLRRTARPKQFSECFDKMITAFAQAEEACRLNEKVGSLERHILHWAMEAPVKDASAFPSVLASLELQLKTVRETVVALKSSMPPDPGRQRPFDDERRIIFLADIFEDAGGKATAYLSAYSETGSMADTAFRKFAQQFYSLLPAEDKRKPGGLDDALRLAVMVRSAKPSGTPSF
jgi:hypothetical protein